MSNETQPKSTTESAPIAADTEDRNTPAAESVRTIEHFYELMDGHVNPIEVPERPVTLDEYLSTASETVFKTIRGENADLAKDERAQAATSEQLLKEENAAYETYMLGIPKQLADVETDPPPVPAHTPFQKEVYQVTARLGQRIRPLYQSPIEIEKDADMMGKKDWRSPKKKAIESIHHAAKAVKEKHEAKLNNDLLLTIRVSSERAAAIEHTLESLAGTEDFINKLPERGVGLIRSAQLQKRRSLLEILIPRRAATRDMARHLGVLITAVTAARHDTDPKLIDDAVVLLHYAQPLNSTKDIAKNIQSMQEWCVANPVLVDSALKIYFAKTALTDNTTK